MSAVSMTSAEAERAMLAGKSSVMKARMVFTLRRGRRRAGVEEDEEDVVVMGVAAAEAEALKRVRSGRRLVEDFMMDEGGWWRWGKEGMDGLLFFWGGARIGY